MSGELIIQRTVLQTIDMYGNVRNLDGATRYFVDGEEVRKDAAANWLQGLAVALPMTALEPVKQPEPGVHPTDADPESLRPLWRLLPNYPFDAACQIARVAANTTQQAQHIIDNDGNTFVVVPDPNYPGQLQVHNAPRP